MRTTGKRMLSILLCLCMAACMLPTVAFAADTGKAIQLGTDALSKEEAVTVERVQAMIDALPGAEKITGGNAEEVKAQLEAIDEAKVKLSNEELDQLDFSRYTEAASALDGLAKPMLTASTKEISVRMNAKNGTITDSVSGGAPTAYGATHTLTVTPQTGRYVIAGYFAGTDYYKTNPAKYQYSNMTLDKISEADPQTGAVQYQFTATEVIPIDNDPNYDYICLYFHCAKLPTLLWTFGNISGEATAPSTDGNTAAIPYVSQKELCGDPNEYTGYYSLADKKDRPYLEWQVISITDKEGNTAGGTVAFDNNHLTYTPTANEAGKTVTITIRPKLGYVEEANTPLSFEIKVKEPVVEQSEFYVTMVTDGYGNAVARPNSAKEGEEIQLTAIPDRGHHLKEWQATSGNIMITNNKFTMPAENVTVKAIFEANTYTVNLDANGGTIASGQDVTSYTYGVGATLPTAGDMTYTGHTFKGWYDNENLTGSPVTAISNTETGNKEYWAKWEINQYTITVKPENGEADMTITQDYGTPVAAPVLTRDGYQFNDWDKTFPATMPAEDLTITAQWTVNQYTITYDLAGGTVEGNPDTYTIETEAFTLKNPTKSGYTFTGWSGTGLDGENNMTVTIPTGSTGNRTYTAHWRYNGSGHSYSYYTIKATAGAGGSISPSGNVSVREGRDQTFTITPDKGYAVANVKIDGKSIGAVKSYTFENVSRTHTIEVIFMKANGNPQTGVFVDVATGSYYEDAVDWAVENGITKGTDDTHFSPDGICTRAQAVTFLWRTAGSPASKTSAMPFTDVPVGSYYYDAVLWAVENGITKGTSDTTFSPNMTCSRAQIVAFLWRSEKSPAAGTANPFADVKSTAYYADAVLWAVKENITKGTTNTTFSPDADCTRAQIVTFLWRCKK